LADLDDAARGSFGFGSVGKTEGGLAARERKAVFGGFAFGVVDIAFGFVALLEAIAIETGGVRTAGDARCAGPLVTVGALIEVASLPILGDIAASFDIGPFAAVIVALGADLLGLLGATGASDFAARGVRGAKFVLAMVACTALSRAIARLGDTKSVLTGLSIAARFGGFPNDASFADIASFEAIRTHTTACDGALGGTFGARFGGRFGLGLRFVGGFGWLGWFGWLGCVGFFGWGDLFGKGIGSVGGGFGRGFFGRRGRAGGER